MRTINSCLRRPSRCECARRYVCQVLCRPTSLNIKALKALKARRVADEFFPFFSSFSSYHHRRLYGLYTKDRNSQQLQLKVLVRTYPTQDTKRTLPMWMHQDDASDAGWRAKRQRQRRRAQLYEKPLLRSTKLSLGKRRAEQGRITKLQSYLGPPKPYESKATTLPFW